MTRQLETPRALAVPTQARRPGLSSFVWLVWRQHSSLVVWSSLAAAAMCGVLLLLQSTLAGTHCWGPLYDHVMPGPANQCVVTAVDHTMLYSWSLRLLQGVVFAPVLIGVLWGAPLVAREHERGTHDLAWGQGIPARRWLAGKVGVLALLVVTLGVPVWLCARLVATSMVRLAPWQVDGAFGWVPFATLSPLVIPYSLATLALGVLASVLLRRMIVAMVVVAIVCAGLGVGTAELLRPHYLPPTTAYAPISLHAAGPPDAHNAHYLAEFGFADAAGHEVIPDPRSFSCASNDAVCLRLLGITQTTAVYQPSDHEAAFQWIEAGLCLLLAAACTSMAVWRVRPR